MSRFLRYGPGLAVDSQLTLISMNLFTWAMFFYERADLRVQSLVLFRLSHEATMRCSLKHVEVR